MLTLTITSSATLTKGERILINALGLYSHISTRTNAKLNTDTSSEANSVNQSINEPVGDDGRKDDGLDMRDGFVFFGCKKSIKQNQTSLDQEQTTIVSFQRTLTSSETSRERLRNSQQEPSDGGAAQRQTLPDSVRPQLVQLLHQGLGRRLRGVRQTRRTDCKCVANLMSL